MNKIIIITIRLDDVGEDVLRKIKEDVVIMTKNDLFKLPIEATVLSYADFEERN